MKGSNTVKLLSTLVLAAWIPWTGVEPHTTWNTCREDSKFGAPNYPKVKYTVDTSSPDAYREMIARLRQLLTSRREYRQGIPILPEQGSVPDSEGYILLEINVADTTRGVTFAINVTNVYIVGYLVGSTRYFFEEAPANASRLLFTEANVTSSTNISASYVQLERKAGERRHIKLGLNSLDAAIRRLANGRVPEDIEVIAKSLIVVLQMVAEAVRFWEIEWNVLRDEGGGFLPNQRMLDFENDWAALSLQIQASDIFAFLRNITIGGEVVDSVQSAVIRAMFLMLYRCAPRLHLQMPREEDQILGRYLGGISLDPPLEKEDDTCKHLADPRSRIVGRDGLCVDVEKFIYRDGNPVILSTCKTTDLRNQLWNFGRDGRIVSLEKCLAATGDTPGSTVMIHECDSLPESAVQWSMSDSGTLSNVGSGLVLDAYSGSGYQLTLQSDTSSSFQAWQSTNVTTAVEVYIHGENNQCIYYNGGKGVYPLECRKDYSWLKWRLYPDGTIRPKEWLQGCLELASLSLVEYPTLTSSYNFIQAEYCSSDPEKHRWIFTHEGSIMNLKSKLVVDADRDYPGYLKAAPFNGGLNQIWTLEFIKYSLRSELDDPKGELR